MPTIERKDGLGYLKSAVGLETEPDLILHLQRISDDEGGRGLEVDYHCRADWERRIQ